MSKYALIDEFHLAVHVPRGLSAAAYRALRRTLDNPRLHAALRRALHVVFHKYPSLSNVRLTVTR